MGTVLMLSSCAWSADSDVLKVIVENTVHSAVHSAEYSAKYSAKYEGFTLPYPGGRMSGWRTGSEGGGGTGSGEWNTKDKGHRNGDHGTDGHRDSCRRQSIQ